MKKNTKIFILCMSIICSVKASDKDEEGSYLGKRTRETWEQQDVAVNSAVSNISLEDRVNHKLEQLIEKSNQTEIHQKIKEKIREEKEKGFNIKAFPSEDGISINLTGLKNAIERGLLTGVQFKQLFSSDEIENARNILFHELIENANSVIDYEYYQSQNFQNSDYIPYQVVQFYNIFNNFDKYNVFFCNCGNGFCFEKDNCLNPGNSNRAQNFFSLWEERLVHPYPFVLFDIYQQETPSYIKEKFENKILSLEDEDLLINLNISFLLDKYIIGNLYTLFPEKQRDVFEDKYSEINYFLSIFGKSFGNHLPYLFPLEGVNAESLDTLTTQDFLDSLIEMMTPDHLVEFLWNEMFDLRRNENLTEGERKFLERVYLEGGLTFDDKSFLNVENKNNEMKAISAFLRVIGVFQPIKNEFLYFYEDLSS